jgi:hypothetical protein
MENESSVVVPLSKPIKDAVASVEQTDSPREKADLWPAEVRLQAIFNGGVFRGNKKKML